MNPTQRQALIKKLDWDKSPLIPAIIQQYSDNRVLMLGFMNQEALNLTLETGLVHYFSRTRGRIWKKGETSGHIQKLIEMFLDCDNDTLLLKVEQEGNVCHTGAQSCFFQRIDIDPVNTLRETSDFDIQFSVIDTLYRTLQERKTQLPDKSYTASLYAKGENEICKKIIEEAGEFAFAIKDSEEKQIVYECADLIYHILVGLSYKNITPDFIKRELKRRFGMSGIEEKNNRK